MTTDAIVALCAGVAGILTAVGALIASLRNGTKLKVEVEERRREVELLHDRLYKELINAVRAVEHLKAGLQGTPPSPHGPLGPGPAPPAVGPVGPAGPPPTAPPSAEAGRSGPPN